MSVDWAQSKTDTCEDDEEASEASECPPLFLALPRPFSCNSSTADQSTEFESSSSSSSPLLSLAYHPQTRCELCARVLFHGSSASSLRVRRGSEGQTYCDSCGKRQRRRQLADQQRQRGAKLQRRRALRDRLLQEISRSLDSLRSSATSPSELQRGLEHVDDLFDQLIIAEERLDAVS